MSNKERSARGKSEELVGKAKEKAGELMDNEQMRGEGRAKRTKGDVKQAGEKLKDTLDR